MGVLPCRYREKHELIIWKSFLREGGTLRGSNLTEGILSTVNKKEVFTVCDCGGGIAPKLGRSSRTPGVSYLVFTA